MTGKVLSLRTTRSLRTICRDRRKDAPEANIMSFPTWGKSLP